jgi:catechol 2,3-dioxygenase-like lactoylglutathione lyase family enzyme/GNAT superfamily N-acetyltransferase
MTIEVRDKTPSDQVWVEETLTGAWGSTKIAVRGRVFDAAALPALIAGDRAGLATYEIDRGRGEAELVTLNALTPRRGIGTALVEALAARLLATSIGVLRVTTTNDKLDALRFYQRRGFRLVAVRPGAVDEARRLKPSIPLLGEHGVPMRDRLELVRDLASSTANALPPGLALATMVPELYVSDLDASRRFWCDLCGFIVAFERPEDRFLYLDREGCQIMLEEGAAPGRRWLTGTLEQPFGRGMNLQIAVDDIAPILSALEAADWPLFLEPEEKWYRAGAREIGVRQFLAQDPDGYLVRFSQSLGLRPAAAMARS